MQKYEFKRGDTFDLGGDATAELDGEEISFAGAAIEAVLCLATAQGVAAGVPFATIAGAWINESAAPGDADYGLFHVPVAKEDTTSWPVGDASIDVAFTFADGRRVTTPGGVFRIVKANRESA